jgi:glutamate racemase
MNRFAHVQADRHGPIGLFDSGIGGTTVLREVAELLPHEDLIYLADQANCPYGPRSADQLRQLSLACTEWLLRHGAKLIVVACNSASAAALSYLREQIPDIPFVGLVPAVKPAALQTTSGVVGVLATPATLAGGLLHETIARWAAGVRVIGQACDGWADLVEQGDLTSPAAQRAVAEHLQPLLDAGADTLVLGCTHYPFLANQIRAIAGPTIQLIDPAPAIARQVARLLEQRQHLQPSDHQRQIRYVTSADPLRFGQLIEQLGLPDGMVAAQHEHPAQPLGVAKEVA